MNADLDAGGQSFKNLLNSFMNDQEDGYYTKLKRVSKFPSMVYLDDNGDNKYDIEFKGSVPEEMKFHI